MSCTAVKSAVDETVFPQVGVTVQFLTAGAVDEAVVEIRCGWCSTLFHVCESCFRGQLYCSPTCRREGSRRRERRARARYRKSVEAREDHRDRMREHRRRQRASVMDHGSQEVDLTMKCAAEAITSAEHCAPRRGFVICAVCGIERRLVIVRPRRCRARDPP